MGGWTWYLGKRSVSNLFLLLYLFQPKIKIKVSNSTRIFSTIRRDTRVRGSSCDSLFRKVFFLILSINRVVCVCCIWCGNNGRWMRKIMCTCKVSISSASSILSMLLHLKARFEKEVGESHNLRSQLTLLSPTRFQFSIPKNRQACTHAQIQKKKI